MCTIDNNHDRETARIMQEFVCSKRRQCETSEIGLWELIISVRLAFDDPPKDEVRRLTIAAVRALVADGGIGAGQFERCDPCQPETWTFVFWNDPTEATVARIEREWDALGREPNAGEIAWLAARDA